MEAGWYRYISQWRLHSNGTILPRFGFGAVQNSCVCNLHHHHVYWRFDFDIETPGNNLVQEFNDPILIGNSHWHNKTFEIRRLKDSSRKRKWKVSNTSTGSAYEIIPGPTDGNADSFGIGDLWVLRYHGGSEIDDGVTLTWGTPDECKEHIDNFINGEAVANQDVVIWYAAHFTHDVNVATGHIVGPTLKCIKW
jgi:Cu2+-containing amine oxidase